MQATPMMEHQWLEQLVGEWTYENEATMGPGQPPCKFTGTQSTRSIGGLWILGEGRGEMPGGGTATMFLTVGYDPQKKRYIGTWFGSMMTHLWTYDGEVDAAGKVLTLNAEGPNFAVEGKTSKYKDVIEVKSEDHHILTSHLQDDEGKWHCFMTAHYRRVK